MTLLVGWLVVLGIILFFLAIALGRFMRTAAEPEKSQQTSAEHGTRRATPVQGRNSQSPFDDRRGDALKRARVAPALSK